MIKATHVVALSALAAVIVGSSAGYISSSIVSASRLLTPVILTALYAAYTALRRPKLADSESLFTIALIPITWLSLVLLLSLHTGAAINPYTPNSTIALYNLILLLPITLGKAIVVDAAARLADSRKLSSIAVLMLLALTLLLNPKLLWDLATDLAYRAPGPIYLLNFTLSLIIVVTALQAARSAGLLGSTIVITGLWASKGLLTWAPAAPQELYLSLEIAVLAAYLPALANPDRPIPVLARLRERIAARRNIILLIITALLSLSTLAAAWKGYWLIIVLTGSMKPSIEEGDLVLIGPPHTPLHTGEIVAYKLGGNLILHRIVNISANGTIITKGDANIAPDNPINAKDIIGVYVAKIPHVGRPLRYLAEKTGNMLLAQMILLAAIAALLIAGNTLGRKLTRTRR